MTNGGSQTRKLQTAGRNEDLCESPLKLFQLIQLSSNPAATHSIVTSRLPTGISNNFKRGSNSLPQCFNSFLSPLLKCPRPSASFGIRWCQQSTVRRSSTSRRSLCYFHQRCEGAPSPLHPHHDCAASCAWILNSSTAPTNQISQQGSDPSDSDRSTDRCVPNTAPRKRSHAHCDEQKFIGAVKQPMVVRMTDHHSSAYHQLRANRTVAESCQMEAAFGLTWRFPSFASSLTMI